MSNPTFTPATSTTPMTPADMSPVRAEIQAGIAKWSAAFDRQDAAAIASCYTNDGQLLPVNSDVVSGRPAIEAFWQNMFGLGVTHADLSTTEIHHTPGARQAVEVGRYTIHAGHQLADTGKYMVLWAQQPDGTWGLHRDIWTTSQPAPAAT